MQQSYSGTGPTARWTGSIPGSTGGQVPRRKGIMLPLKKGHFFLYAGPYREINIGRYMGFKLAAEIDKQCDIDLPIRDYHVPNRKLLDGALKQAIDLILKGQPVYAGCWGGQGRTGLVLAIIAKLWGFKDPIKYVRDSYNPHAVETDEQREFVNSYKPPFEVVAKVAWAKFKSNFGSDKCLTKGMRAVQ